MPTFPLSRIPHSPSSTLSPANWLHQDPDECSREDFSSTRPLFFHCIFFSYPHTPINHIIIFCCITSVFLSLRAADISPPTLAMTSTQLPSPGSFPGISRDPGKATGRCFGGSVPRISTITTSSKIDFCLLLDSSRLGFLALLGLAPRTSAGFRSKMGCFCYALTWEVHGTWLMFGNLE